MQVHFFIGCDAEHSVRFFMGAWKTFSREKNIMQAVFNRSVDLFREYVEIKKNEKSIGDFFVTLRAVCLSAMDYTARWMVVRIAIVVTHIGIQRSHWSREYCFCVHYVLPFGVWCIQNRTQSVTNLVFESESVSAQLFRRFLFCEHIALTLRVE